MEEHGRNLHADGIDGELSGFDGLELPVYADDTLRGLDTAELVTLLARDEDRVPRNVIDECIRRGEEIEQLLAPLFRTRHSLGSGWLPLHAIQILGALRSESAGRTLVAALRIIELEYELSDWCSDYWPFWFRNKPDSVMTTLAGLVGDRSCDADVRALALECLIAMGDRASPECLDAQLDVAAHIATDQGEDIDMRVLAANVLLDFPRTRHRALFDALQADSLDYFLPSEVEASFADRRDQPRWDTLDDPLDFYSLEEIEARQYSALDEDDEDDEDDPFSSDFSTFVTTHVRETPKIGRNDPCPCGSGKKYKKCCLRGQTE